VRRWVWEGDPRPISRVRAQLPCVEVCARPELAAVLELAALPDVVAATAAPELVADAVDVVVVVVEFDACTVRADALVVAAWLAATSVPVRATRPAALRPPASRRARRAGCGRRRRARVVAGAAGATGEGVSSWVIADLRWSWVRVGSERAWSCR
jgi:hypothetical protein